MMSLKIITCYLIRTLSVEYKRWNCRDFNDLREVIISVCVGESCFGLYSAL